MWGWMEEKLVERQLVYQYWWSVEEVMLTDFGYEMR
jgi:hypothetical protein